VPLSIRGPCAALFHIARTGTPSTRSLSPTHPLNTPQTTKKQPKKPPKKHHKTNQKTQLTWLWKDSPYVIAARKLFDMAIASNDQGDPFPIWGTCLGHQLLQILATNISRNDLLVETDAVGHPANLDFTEAAKQSRLFGGIQPDLYEKLASHDYDIALENHMYGVPPAFYQRWPDLAEWFSVLSTTKDRNGLEYISTIEGVKYPFFGKGKEKRDGCCGGGGGGDVWALGMGGKNRGLGVERWRGRRVGALARARARGLSRKKISQPPKTTKNPKQNTGTQWHPEKPPFEFTMDEIPHTIDAIRVSQHLANVFVDTARKSSHKPRSHEEDLELQIYDTCPIFAARFEVVAEDNYDGPDAYYCFDTKERPPIGPDDAESDEDGKHKPLSADAPRSNNRAVGEDGSEAYSRRTNAALGIKIAAVQVEGERQQEQEQPAVAAS
jgi:hypothetical protein